MFDCILSFLLLADANTLINVFVSSRLDYCYHFIVRPVMCSNWKSSNVQNIAARIFISNLRHVSTSHQFFTLHWLPVHVRSRTMRRSEDLQNCMCSPLYTLSDLLKAFIPFCVVCSQNTELLSVLSTEVRRSQWATGSSTLVPPSSGFMYLLTSDGLTVEAFKSKVKTCPLALTIIGLFSWSLRPST